MTTHIKVETFTIVLSCDFYKLI